VQCSTSGLVSSQLYIPTVLLHFPYQLLQEYSIYIVLILAVIFCYSCYGTENLIWFTDEKLFTVAAPSNTQNDRVYAPAGVRTKNIAPIRLLRCRPTFSRLLMVSMGVSALGHADLHFIDAGVKINGQYYCEVLLIQKLLPNIKEFSDYFTFQQDGTPAHRAKETVSLLNHDTSDFIPPSLWPPNSPDLNPVDYKVWVSFSSEFTARKSKLWMS